MCNKESCITINCACCNKGENAVIPSIGENGNWFVGDEDTGVAAQGPEGPMGPQGPQGSGSEGNDSVLPGLTLLYDGPESSALSGDEIKLLGAVTDYRMLLIESIYLISGNPDIKYAHMKTEVIVDPIVGGNVQNGQYSYKRYYIGAQSNQSSEFYFSDPYTFKGTTGTIGRIYGIK